MDKQQLTECYTLLKDISPIIDSVQENKSPAINESKDYITEKYRLNNYNFTQQEKLKVNAVLQLLEMSV